MESSKAEHNIYYRFVKNALDFLISLITLLVLLPLLILIAILIKIESEGPVFFTQERPGKDKKIFKVYKFRTMIKDAEKQQQVGIEVTESDFRITAFGKFLRRFKIDELAQLINVMKGDMSLVGPRPTLPEYLEQYEEWELKRFDVKPGLTGRAQINGNIYLNRSEKSAYDVEYVENISLINDIKIIIKTIAIVFLGEDKFVSKKNSKLSEEDSDK